jgi:hypothetical protein
MFEMIAARIIRSVLSGFALQIVLTSNQEKQAQQLRSKVVACGER